MLHGAAAAPRRDCGLRALPTRGDAICTRLPPHLAPTRSPPPPTHPPTLARCPVHPLLTTRPSASSPLRALTRPSSPDPPRPTHPPRAPPRPPTSVCISSRLGGSALPRYSYTCRCRCRCECVYGWSAWVSTLHKYVRNSHMHMHTCTCTHAHAHMHMRMHMIYACACIRCPPHPRLRAPASRSRLRRTARRWTWCADHSVGTATPYPSPRTPTHPHPHSRSRTCTRTRMDRICGSAHHHRGCSATLCSMCVPCTIARRTLRPLPPPRAACACSMYAPLLTPAL